MPLKNRTLQIVALELLLTSFIVLFQELTLIRWLGTQIRALAYFPNLILISAFLGLGIGCLRAGKKSLWWIWPISIAAICISTFFISKIVFTHQGISEHLWLLYFDADPDSLVINNIYLPIIFYFILSTFSFVTLGQIIGERIEIFRQHSKILIGYAWDILGSILGICAFSLVNYLGLFPIVWFSIFLLIGFFLTRTLSPPTKIIYLILAILSVGLVDFSEKAQLYSPYYALNYNSTADQGFQVLTNRSLHQRAVKMTDSPEVTPQNRLTIDGYNVPYQKFLQEIPEKILILGAGTGNDVAVALNNGVQQIDVVEIDPEILELGKKYHPNKPYDSPKVRIFNTDARSYLANTNEKYDLIVFGTLDSMPRLSALSNVRLDNFVYTRESLETAKNCLKPTGGVMLLFAVTRDYIDLRLTRLLTEIFQQAPVRYYKRGE